MAKFKAPIDIDGWTTVSRTSEPTAHAAWADWRRCELNCRFVPEHYTVPSEFPPRIEEEARSYVQKITEIREEIKWTSRGASLPRDPTPWR